MKTIKLPVFKNCDPKEESIFVDFYDYGEDITKPDEIICEKFCPYGNECQNLKTKNGFLLVDICNDNSWIDFSKINIDDDNFGQTYIPSKEALNVANISSENDQTNNTDLKEESVSVDCDENNTDLNELNCEEPELKTIQLPIFKNCDPNEESVFVDFYGYEKEIVDKDGDTDFEDEELICMYCPLAEICLDVISKNGFLLVELCREGKWLDFSKIDKNYYDWYPEKDGTITKFLYNTNHIPSIKALELAFENDPETLKIINDHLNTPEEDENNPITSIQEL